MPLAWSQNLRLRVRVLCGQINSLFGKLPDFLKLPLSETIDILSEMRVKGNIRSSEVLESLRVTR